MDFNVRMALIRQLLQDPEHLVRTRVSEGYQDALGILYSWPTTDPAGLEVAVAYFDDFLRALASRHQPGTTVLVGLEEALSVQRLVEDWRVHRRRALSWKATARVCHEYQLFQLGPTKIVVHKKNWGPLKRSLMDLRLDIKKEDERRVHWRKKDIGFSPRWWVECAREEHLNPKLGNWMRPFDPTP